MKQDKKSDNQRKVDKNIKKSFQKVSSGFSLVSNVDIQAWKAYLVIFFVAGFFASLIWGAYSTWYLNTKASATATMYTLTTNQAHRAGENFQTQILLDTSSQNIVAVQAVATFDPTLVTISSLDNSVSDFPNELAKNVDSQNHKIFAASGKQTPGINSTQAKIAVVNITALKDFNGAGITLVPVGTDMSATSAAILDDGKGTNVLVAVMSRFTNPADTTAPVVSNGSPSGALPSGTTSKTLAVTTNEKSACKYSTSSGTAYADMTNSFSTSDGISHSANISGLTDGKSYNYYVRCIDTAVIPNVDTSDYKISFSINSPAPQDVTPPTISGGSPTGTLAAGTAQATLKVSTNENATCKYSTTSGTAYSSMSNTFSTTGSTSHSTSISGLIDGKSYSYFVRCRDAAGNATTNDYPVSFSVASSQAFGPIISSVSAKTLSLSSVVVTWKTDKPATSQVEYGTTTSYGNSTSLDSNLVTSHSQDLTGLSKNIRYHFRVRSKDANGNETVSGDSVFRARNK